VLDDVRVITPPPPPPPAPQVDYRFLDNDGPWGTDPHAIIEIRNCTFNGDPVGYDDIGGPTTGVTIIND